MPKDYVEAAKWYRKAADQGYAAAQSNLGLCYVKGEGVPKDYVEAYALFNLSSATDESALKRRALIVKYMTGEQIAAAQKRTKELQKELGRGN